jgi:hypothetical protein
MSPKRTWKSTKKVTDSIRYKLGGSTHIFTLVEFRAMLIEAVDQLEAAGITHVKPCHLYIPPVDAKGNPITRARGQDLEDVTISAPYRSAADEHGI